ncbi:hypothetical protein UFOVP1433_60 [uncultured Caudovirales phage]|uniref:Uncharacterized protein n=1 Tax=uncultured Caudovirales phage TaxID=2100421 RepID=A0A6J5SHH7_9CAUD|nr:hypothetical protein UFOVP553_60 [uncultured Caudovirales phage]CAB4213105.1 hypothetical protein UFOVP1433_60 [uncultured Caudovirales phage]
MRRITRKSASGTPPGAPDRFFREIAPALETYAQSADGKIIEAIADAQKAKLGDDMENFLAKRFGRGWCAP